jgi:hypothetical protein
MKINSHLIREQVFFADKTCRYSIIIIAVIIVVITIIIIIICFFFLYEADFPGFSYLQISYSGKR